MRGDGVLRAGADSPQGITLPRWAVPGKGAVQHPKVWVTLSEGPPEGSPAVGEARRQAAKGKHWTSECR